LGAWESFVIEIFCNISPDLAIKQLKRVATIPSTINYGLLRLHPYWDELRGDPRFEQIVASLALK